MWYEWFNDGKWNVHDDDAKDDVNGDKNIALHIYHDDDDSADYW